MSQTDLRTFLSSYAELPRTTTLSREEGLRTLLLHLKPLEQIAEHQTRGAITVHCLQGGGVLLLAGERVGLKPGLWISLPPGAPHSVSAEQDTLLLVTVSEPKTTVSTP